MKLPKEWMGVAFWATLAIVAGIFAAKHIHTVIWAAVSIACLVIAGMLISDVRHGP
jgi:hypothetical protein